MNGDSREHEALNLSRRPFVNSRPVVRISLLLWLLGILLLLGNASLIWQYLEGSKTKRAELAAKAAEIETARKESEAAKERLATLDLTRQNQQVAYLNRKIQERTFSWSLLLDRIAQVLPPETRIERLAPRGVVAEREPETRDLLRMATEKNRPVTLAITGESRSDEATLLLIDNLFAHPAFHEPNLAREAQNDKDSRLSRFEMTVDYLPDAVVPVLSDPPAISAPPTPSLSAVPPISSAPPVPSISSAPPSSSRSSRPGAPAPRRVP